MSKRKKAIIILLIVLAVLYFLLFPAFEDRRMAGVFPFSSAVIPDDYTEYSMQGLKLNAPDCLETELDVAGISKYLSKDMEKYDLEILALEQQQSAASELERLKEQPNLFCKWLTGRGWLTTLGMKKIGYKIPESDNELLYLLEKIDSKDYNPLSLTEAYTFTKLSVLGGIMIPAMMGFESYDKAHPLEEPLEVEECTYYLEKESFNAIIRQERSEGGRYRLFIEYYPDSDADAVRNLLIQSNDPALAQTVAASVHPE